MWSMRERLLKSLRLVGGMWRGHLQGVLLASFFLVALVPVVFGSLAISKVIQDYLATAQGERVERDMRLAQAFYEDALRQVSAVCHSLALDDELLTALPDASGPGSLASAQVDQMIQHRIISNEVRGTQFIGVFRTDGGLFAGRVLLESGAHVRVSETTNWTDVPIVNYALQQGTLAVATEVIPDIYFESINLAEQVRIPLIDTPHASPELHDPREGRAALVLIAVSPIYDSQDALLGFVVVFHLFNRDFTLVDRIKETAGVDTATIFLGDQRVSTNVRTERGERAIGTRVSEEVAQVVLLDGQDYTGRAFVVNENFITRYSPLRDHAGQVVGILYVGALEANFLSLVQEFNLRVVQIALVGVLIAVVLSMPVAQSIARPIRSLVTASSKVARGDMTVRVEERGRGEVRHLAEAFNQMVSELQSTQDELLRAKNLASVGQLAAGVAHEINNPLGTIMLYSDILLRQTPPTPEYQEDLNTISREAARCKEIVAALLNFARQQPVSAQETDVNEVLEELLHDVEKQPLLEKVTVARDLSEGALLMQADPGQLRQVFMNLVKNACEAMPEGGTLTVTSRLESEGERVVVAVEDTGIGIPEENIPKLFTPFFTTKPTGKGTGLGLAISYGIVKMHRGQIRVESEVGKGTRFTVTLPTRAAYGRMQPQADGAIDEI
jgi:two-component system NtrC family sensor kinase